MSADSLAIAPPRRKRLARGKDPATAGDAAPGHASQNTSSPEGAKEGGTKQAGVGKTIGHLIEPRREKAIPSEHPELPYIGLEHIESHSTRLLGSVPATQMRSTAKRFYSGDVLYSRLRPYLNKVWHADREGLCSSEFIVMPGNAEIDSNFLRYRLNSSDFVRFANSLNAGDRPRVDFDQISSFILPTFSLVAQRAAVAEIEKQFTRLEAGVAALRRVQANLKRYRAAVLKDACEGRLVPTEAELAKAKNRKFESGDALLRRILTERRQIWRGRGQYKEPAPSNAAELASLSEGWTWAALEQLLIYLRNGWGLKPNAETGIPILRISAVRPMSVNLADVRFLGGPNAAYADYTLSEGDLLFTRYNGNPHLTGVCGVVPPTTLGVVHPDKLIRVKLVPKLCEPKFVGMVANVGASRAFLASRSRTTAGQTGISGSDLRGLPVPLPPLAEQTRIVAEVERRLSVVEELEAFVFTNLRRAARLRQSILQKAFSAAL